MYIPASRQGPGEEQASDRPVWADPADRPVWTEPGPLQANVTADLCVVGLGGSGLSAVDEALDLGASVVGIDAGSVAGRAAGRNGGFLLSGPERAYHHAVEAYGRSVASAYTRRTEEEIARLAERYPAWVRPGGSLRIVTLEEERADVARELACRQADGFDVEPYEGPEGTGFLALRDAATNPLMLARARARALLGRGAALHCTTPALSLEPGNLRTPGGVVRAGAIVVAVDGGLERLVPELAGSLRTARLQMVATAPAPEVRFPLPVYTEWGFVFWQQSPEGRIAIGGCRNLAREEEWTHEPGVTPVIQEALEQRLRGLGVTAPVTHRWSGHSAYTEHRRPILREVRPRVVVAGGYSGHGNVTGSLYAREAVRLALQGRRTVRLLDAEPISTPDAGGR